MGLDLPEPDGEPLVDLPGIEQVALVVSDLDEALARYVGVLGIGPWTIYDASPADFADSTYYGEPVDFGMRYGLALVGDTMLELIEPTEGTSIYHDHLQEHGEGMHHVAYFSWSETEAYDVVDRFEAAGIDVMQHGDLWGTEFWYFDVREELDGLVFETGIRRDVPERDSEVYPPGADPSEGVQ